MSGDRTLLTLPEGSAWGEVGSPVGPLTLVVTPAGIQRLAFGPLASVAKYYRPFGGMPAEGAPTEGAPTDDVLTGGVVIDGAAAVAAPSSSAPGPLAGHPVGAVAVRRLAEYFDGRRRAFDLPVDWSLTSGVQRTILGTLHTRVPYGATVGYGRLALLAGRTQGAARLVGTAMGSNPVAIVVPCHRVIAADGGIGGFGGGLAAKRLLLALEGALPTPLFDV